VCVFTLSLLLLLPSHVRLLSLHPPPLLLSSSSSISLPHARSSHTLIAHTHAHRTHHPHPPLTHLPHTGGGAQGLCRAYPSCFNATAASRHPPDSSLSSPLSEVREEKLRVCVVLCVCCLLCVCVSMCVHHAWSTLIGCVLHTVCLTPSSSSPRNDRRSPRDISGPSLGHQRTKSGACVCQSVMRMMRE